MKDKLKSTKLQLTWFFTLVSTVALFMDKLDANVYSNLNKKLNIKIPRKEISYY